MSKTELVGNKTQEEIEKLLEQGKKLESYAGEGAPSLTYTILWSASLAAHGEDPYVVQITTVRRKRHTLYEALYPSLHALDKNEPFDLSKFVIEENTIPTHLAYKNRAPSKRRR